MTHGRESHAWLKTGAGLVERLDKMVQAGRLTEEDADRLRAAAGAGELDDAVRELQLKHATARVRAAVDEGRLTQYEARALVNRLENGEDLRILRGLRRGSRRGSGKDG